MSNGYLTSFDGTTLINHTTLRALKAAVITPIPHLLIYTLPTGTRVNYNGTSDAVVTPGTASQDIFATSGGEAVFDALYAKLGNYSASGAGGGLILTKLVGGTSTATAYLSSIEDMTGRIHGPSGNTTMIFTVTFELVTNL
jgi:hypothetical protein